MSLPPIAPPSLGAGVLVVPFDSTTCVCVGVASVVDVVLLMVSVSMVAATIEEELYGNCQLYLHKIKPKHVSRYTCLVSTPPDPAYVPFTNTPPTTADGVTASSTALAASAYAANVCPSDLTLIFVSALHEINEISVL